VVEALESFGRVCIGRRAFDFYRGEEVVHLNVIKLALKGYIASLKDTEHSSVSITGMRVLLTIYSAEISLLILMWE
jgi:hypothetical protein